MAAAMGAATVQGNIWTTSNCMTNFIAIRGTGFINQKTNIFYFLEHRHQIKFYDRYGYGYGGGAGGGYGTPSGMAPTFSTAVQNPTGTCKLAMMANPILSQEKLWKLFNVVPGLEYCELTQVL